MPAAAVFQLGKVCGAEEMVCSSPFAINRLIGAAAEAMSFTTMQMCWNHRSQLRESGGMARPGVSPAPRVCTSVSSSVSSPSRRRTSLSWLLGRPISWL